MGAEKQPHRGRKNGASNISKRKTIEKQSSSNKGKNEKREEEEKSPDKNSQKRSTAKREENGAADHREKNGKNLKIEKMKKEDFEKLWFESFVSPNLLEHGDVDLNDLTFPFKKIKIQTGQLPPHLQKQFDTFYASAISNHWHGKRQPGPGLVSLI